MGQNCESICFYTTALNTGAKFGECKRRKTSTLSLPPPYFGINTGTRLQPQRCFQIPKHWNIYSFQRIPASDWSGRIYCTALEDDSLAAVIVPWKDSVIAFAISQLKEFKSRDDYWELLELTTMFFGGISPRGIHFRYPGAVHHARWMERAIFFVKMVLFRSQ